MSDATKGRIPKLFESPIDSATALVLATSVYFQARWSKKFSESLTKVWVALLLMKNFEIFPLPFSKIRPAQQFSTVKQVQINQSASPPDVIIHTVHFRTIFSISLSILFETSIIFLINLHQTLFYASFPQILSFLHGFFLPSHISFKFV